MREQRGCHGFRGSSPDRPSAGDGRVGAMRGRTFRTAMLDETVPLSESATATARDPQAGTPRLAASAQLGMSARSESDPRHFRRDGGIGSLGASGLGRA
jgi:hypothetical protein